MRRLLAALALAVLLPGAAFAQGNAARDLLLFGSNQRAVASLNFVSGAYTLSGQTYPSFQAMPGASFTRASTKTALTSAGLVVSFAAGVPAITDQGFLPEEARTNLELWSQDFTNAHWTKTGSSVAGNSTSAPDGTTTAGKLTEDTSNGVHFAFSADATSGLTQVMSVYAKAAERTQIALQLGAVAAFYNISNGTVVSGTGASIQALGNGWYRCILAPGVNNANANAQVYLALSGGSSYQGVSGDGAFIWGAQVETGTFVTSYIPTTSSAATRAADVASLTYSGSPTSATVTYGANSTASPSPTSPLNLGASSGGAWVNNYVAKVVVK